MPHAAPGARCATCWAEPPRHAGVRAAVAYGPAARAIALRLKYGGRLGLADTIALQMRRVMPQDAELLVPVPLHRMRLWRRGFNQATLMARSLTVLTGVPTACDLLQRCRATPVLRGLGRAGRRRAVRGAFAVKRSGKGRLAGRHVVLVDDIHTSGATADACTRVLLSAGARSVTILCWARVLGGGADERLDD